jgi:2-succinyl-5-enolpyruvyl-6-hydroxy-3-cyclohexene-1-carboxylate synthase
VVELCAQAHLPLLAEPSSNARRGPAALATYRILLASPLATEIERVVVVGRPTLSRPVNALLARRDVELIVVSERGDWPDPGLRQPFVVDAVTLEPDESDWLARWQAADHRTAARLTDLLEHSDVLTGPAVARAVVDGIAPGSPLVLGSSNPIRDADLAPVRDDLGEVYANRGLAGIDGTLSTATGIALALGRPTHALVGDLTFLHDLTGLVIGPDEPRPDLRIVVANDDGGSIFATLEHGRPALEESHERIFGTAHHADLAAIAGGLGITAARAGSRDELAEALRVPPRRIEVLEATIDRSGRRALDQAITALAATL